MTNVSRRTALIGLGLSAAVPRPAVAAIATTGFSAEYQAYLAAREAVTACSAGYNPEGTEAEDEAHEQRIDALMDRLWDCSGAILDRVPANWDDVAEVAHVVFIELWDTKTWDQHSHSERLDGALLKAIFTLKSLPIS